VRLYLNLLSKNRRRVQVGKILSVIVSLLVIAGVAFGIPEYLKQFALAEDVRTLRQQTQQSDYCMMKELRLISVRNDLRDYNNTYGKGCIRCDDKQKEDYGILLEEKEIQKKLMEVCK
jgi:hypothetical protein